jgi:dynein heavy chain
MIEELKDYENASVKCDDLFDSFEKALDTSTVINRREQLFKLKKTDYASFQALNQEFKPFKDMWYLARDYYFNFTTWMTGILSQIDRDELTSEINKACKNLIKIEKISFKDKRSAAEIAKELRRLYEDFKPYLPLVCALRNPNLKMRHWKSLTELTGIELDAELNVSLEDLLSKGVLKFSEDINEISDCASRE